ncbi:MAG: YbhB/YbcL family Raf kinase inhibitor-like protein [Vicinamibacterales bacterium]
MHLTTTAFTAGAVIPAEYTCDGHDESPPLAWDAVPEGACSLAVICHDPDAPRGTWVHWVVYDLPPDTPGLPQGVPPTPTLDSGARQGQNDFGRHGYGGPCPPPGAPHRYVFTLYAIDRRLGEAAGRTPAEITRAMKGHVVATAELVGTYARRSRASGIAG